MDSEGDEFAEIPVAAQRAFTIVAENIRKIPEERRPGGQPMEVALVREEIQMVVHEAVWPFDGGQQGGGVLYKQLGSRKFKRMVGRPADGRKIQSAQERNVAKRNDRSGGKYRFVRLRAMPDEAMGGWRFRVFDRSREDDFGIVGTCVIRMQCGVQKRLRGLRKSVGNGIAQRWSRFRGERDAVVRRKRVVL